MIGFSTARRSQFRSGTSTCNVVEGNFIGTNAADANLGNLSCVSIIGRSGNTIGGTTANVIGFNTIVVIEQGCVQSNLIAGNFIGTDAGGDKLGNPWVSCSAVPRATRSAGTISAAANIIGFSTRACRSAGSVNYGENVVLGNFIGTDDSRRQTLGNCHRHRLSAFPGPTRSAAGPPPPPTSSASAATRVSRSSRPRGTLVEGNFIGTDAAGHNLANALGVGHRQLLPLDSTIGGTAAGGGQYHRPQHRRRRSSPFSGSGDTIRGNSIYGNSQDIVLRRLSRQRRPGRPVEPVLFSPPPSSTAINYTVTGTVGDVYIIDFYGNSPLPGLMGALLGR